MAYDKLAVRPAGAPSRRGPAAHRAPVLYRTVAEVGRKVADRRPELELVFARCFLNSLETTVELLPDGTTFVATGDIPAMWLRDSAAQVAPYVRYAAEDDGVRRLIAGLIRRHALCVAIDPYANAFNKAPNGRGHQRDRTVMGPWIWERKWELDSLCYPIWLAHAYWQATREASVFDEDVHRMLRLAVDTMRTEQRHAAEESAYRFERDDGLLPTDTLTREGRGSPVRQTGMVWSGFRPSDDACTYGYLIPANMFAVVVLGHVVELAEDVYGDPGLADDADRLRRAIDRGINRYGLVEHPRYGPIYAYEVDGLGNHNLMDDANVPSLLSIPYLGYCPADDPVYRNTRSFVLGRDNPCYFEGRYAKGIGSPHTPAGYVWPIALAIQGLTSDEADERDDLLSVLVSTTAGTGYMHESFDPNEPARFTRPWFAWANSLFAELVLRHVGVGR